VGWIKVEHETIDKPEVLEMAEMLGTSADEVFGKLFRVWCWFDLQSIDGNAGGVTGNALKRFIDRLVSSQGFAASMEKVGWLTDTGMPNFNNHNGESAKKRAVTNKRVKRHRNADDVTKAFPEKRREEKIKTTPSVAFEKFWKTYPDTPRKVAKASCLKTWERHQLDPIADQIVSKVEALKSSDPWQRGFEPAPLTFLNQRRWEDEIAAIVRPWEGAH